jgi:hypothetical protein
VIAELDRAEVCDQERTRRLVTDDRESALEIGILECCPLGTYAHPDSVPFSGTGKPPVHFRCLRVAAGHRCDEEGKGEPVPEEPGPSIDPVHIAFGEGAVDEPDIGKTGPARLNLLPDADPEMVEFPP